MSLSDIKTLIKHLFLLLFCSWNINEFFNSTYLFSRCPLHLTSKKKLVCCGKCKLQLRQSNRRYKRKLRQFPIYDLLGAVTLVSVFEMSYDASFVWTADYLFNFTPNDNEICYIRLLLLSSNTSTKAHDLRAWVASNMSGMPRVTTGFISVPIYYIDDDSSADYITHVKCKLFPFIFCIYIEALIICIDEDIK